MRRSRLRSYTIDAENEEDYIKQYELRKSRLSQLNFEKNKIHEQIPENEEDELGCPKKPKKSFHFDNSEDSDDDLGAVNNDDDEDLLRADYDNEEDTIINKDNIEERGIEILVNFLKTSVQGGSLNESKGGNLEENTIIFNKIKNKNIMSLSGNAIYDLSIRELVDNILLENDNEYIKSSEGNNNSLRDFIFQNIESDSTLKIMVMSNNKNTKNSFINKFFGIENIKKEDTDIFDEPFVIKKKMIKLFNKNICLQIFDTSDEFHKNSIAINNVYYNKASAFFIFIESSSHNVENYLDFIYDKINKFFNNRTVVIFGVNMLFKIDCTIDNINLREYANEKDMLYIPININNFDFKNSIIKNLFNLILIKGIDHKLNNNINSSLRKGSKDKKLGGFKNKLTSKINQDSNQKKNIYDITKMNVPSSLGYKKRYKMKHITAFDIEDNNDKIVKRKLSVDI